MNSKSKITVIVLCQIGLIMGSFLSVAIWESQFSLLGNSVNVAGKNRLLTSQFLNEVKDYGYLNFPDANPEKQLELLEQNILFLKNGGEENGLKLDPLNEQFYPEWEQVYFHFQIMKSDFEHFQSITASQTLSPLDVTSLEVNSVVLIRSSDVLVSKIGLMTDNLSRTLLILQSVLVAINVAVHVMMVILISKIFKNEFKKTLKMEKLATVGELSSRLAHDMRNPLSYINMSTQLLKSKVTEKETVEKLDVIEKGIQRMSHQINDVMDFVRSKEPELKLWDLKSILEDCLDRLKIPDSIKVTLPEKSILIKCDRTQFEILFINLISNALDSIKNNGSIEIRVNTSPNETKIEIIDSGNGIPNNKLDQIFEPLVTFKESGTGLGLASCKNIVKNHKGVIYAKNNPTTFTVILPNY
ncbi:HAMP domain-containing histidine kinase [Candidatus Nitrosopumilus sp. SW]|uniref:sensor histidine kinase n=1 Tax=Candidatus Nitrosopumilus sp. SW TaxID=2508726 RepID=UPI00114F3A49|nr:HAMP domain-containing sensor histidine kinase [Candidatus Nitrosopumilus sp. SW]QDI88504.1 HAMP domain-containing histidine kinase [Candidatus Nitrosopumilus sp. SW]